MKRKFFNICIGVDVLGFPVYHRIFLNDKTTNQYA
jgi:hypothetical protein